MIETLADRIGRAISEDGPAAYDEFVKAAAPVLLWVDHFERSIPTNCGSLLSGLRSVVAEACACTVMSLARPALGAMRSEVDVALAWVYYSEHPREWRNINASGEGYKLKTELLRVFEAIEPAFKRRFALLKSRRTRSEEDPYRLLSAHVHVQSESVLPSLSTLGDIVQPGLSEQLARMQGEVSEFVSDLFFSMYAGDWVALPTELTARLRERMASSAQYQEFIRPL
jgi:hypothetical protein